jgi:hypothetical protein
MSNLLCVLPHRGGRQSRVRSDVQTRLTRGLKAPRTLTAFIRRGHRLHYTHRCAPFHALWVPRRGVMTDTDFSSTKLKTNP